MSDRAERSRGAEMLEAIEEIYACATDSARFNDLPACLTPVLDTSAVNIWCSMTDLQSVSIAKFGLTKQQLSDYLENWIHGDGLVGHHHDSGSRVTWRR